MAHESGKMFQNKDTKKFNNTQKVYSSMYEESSKVVEKKKESKYNYDINTKINNLFKSPTYVYKIDVIIEIDDKVLEKRIIGRNKNNLITIDNEYIAIDKIKDIYLK